MSAADLIKVGGEKKYTWTLFFLGLNRSQSVDRKKNNKSLLYDFTFLGKFAARDGTTRSWLKQVHRIKNESFATCVA